MLTNKSRRRRQLMTKTSTRIVLFVALIALLGLPTSILTARARQQEQQEGPTKPSPTPQPGAAPKAPTGQQQAAKPAQPASQAPQGAIAVQSNVVNIDAVVPDSD